MTPAWGNGASAIRRMRTGQLPEHNPAGFHWAVGLGVHLLQLLLNFFPQRSDWDQTEFSQDFASCLPSFWTNTKRERKTEWREWKRALFPFWKILTEVSLELAQTHILGNLVHWLVEVPALGGSIVYGIYEENEESGGPHPRLWGAAFRESVTLWKIQSFQ